MESDVSVWGVHKEEVNKKGGEKTVLATGDWLCVRGVFYGDRLWGAYSGIAVVEMCRGS